MEQVGDEASLISTSINKEIGGRIVLNFYLFSDWCLTWSVLFFSRNDNGTDAEMKRISCAIAIVTTVLFMLCFSMVAIALHFSPVMDKMAREYCTKNLLHQFCDMITFIWTCLNQHKNCCQFRHSFIEIMTYFQKYIFFTVQVDEYLKQTCVWTLKDGVSDWTLSTCLTFILC